jgi:hypothetical protein
MLLFSSTIMNALFMKEKYHLLEVSLQDFYLISFTKLNFGGFFSSPSWRENVSDTSNFVQKLPP